MIGEILIVPVMFVCAFVFKAIDTLSIIAADVEAEASLSRERIDRRVKLILLSEFEENE